MRHDPWTQPGAQGQPALNDTSQEAAWWRIGVLDAERNQLPRESPFVGVTWETQAMRTRYQEGYRYKRTMIEREG